MSRLSDLLVGCVSDPRLPLQEVIEIACDDLWIHSGFCDDPLSEPPRSLVKEGFQYMAGLQILGAVSVGELGDGVPCLLRLERDRDESEGERERERER